MAVAIKHEAFVLDIGKKVHDLSADTIKVMLTNTAPVATNSVKANLTDISAGNGYTAGGTQATITSYTQTSGVAKLILVDVVFTASGGTIGPFRYAAVYNDTPAGSPTDPLIQSYDYGSSITLQSGETFTVDFDASAGFLTIG